MISRLLYIFLLIPYLTTAQNIDQIQIDTTDCYPWLRKEANVIQFFNKKSLANFKLAWTEESPVSVAIFGDSHVQPDIYPGTLRKRLQNAIGDGGFGMLFPYSAAKTYSMVDYKSTHTGLWKQAKSIEYLPKLPLGIMGAAIQTQDSSATFTITFRDSLPDHYRKLKIFCQRDTASFDFFLKSVDAITPVQVFSSATINVLPYIELTLPKIGQSITLQLIRSKADQKHFNFQGMSLESTQKEGLLVHCLGVGGAQYGSLLRQTLFSEQLPGIDPQLAIIDFGTNDFVYDNTIPKRLENDIESVIDLIRLARPNCSILLTTAMDMNFRGKKVTASYAFAELIREIASKKECAFWDWYEIAGGLGSMDAWQGNKLAQKDGVHLTRAGYVLKGNLLADALLRNMQTHTEPDSVIVAMRDARPEIIPFPPQVKAKKKAPVSKKKAKPKRKTRKKKSTKQ